MNNIDIPRFPDALPSYYPTHHSVRVSSDQALENTAQQIRDQQMELVKSAEQYLGYATSRPQTLDSDTSHRLLQNKANTYRKYHGLLLQIAAADNFIKDATRSVLRSRVGEDDLTLLNLEVYRNTDCKNFATQLSLNLESLGAPDTSLAKDPLYVFLRYGAFVVKNPTLPLPDEHEDEELAVEGGQISLKDPHSLNFFKDPLQSTKCGHVFEKEHIYKLIELVGAASVACPVTGCAEQISRRDLRDDLLMKLRVRAFTARKPTLQRTEVARVV